jgi:hypothetical protein
MNMSSIPIYAGVVSNGYQNDKRCLSAKAPYGPAFTDKLLFSGEKNVAEEAIASTWKALAKGGTVEKALVDLIGSQGLYVAFFGNQPFDQHRFISTLVLTALLYGSHTVGGKLTQYALENGLPKADKVPFKEIIKSLRSGSITLSKNTLPMIPTFWAAITHIANTIGPVNPDAATAICLVLAVCAFQGIQATDAVLSWIQNKAFNPKGK